MPSSNSLQLDVSWINQLTLAQLQALSTEVDREENRLAMERSFAEFVRGAWHVLEPGRPLVWNWHLDVICAYLEAVDRGDITRLIINIPPGTMKSLITGVFYPSWVWIRRPAFKWLTGSNEAGLATRDSMKMRTLIESQWFQIRWGHKVQRADSEETEYENVYSIVDGVRISKAQAAKHLFYNTMGGFREAIGVLAKVTGKRGDGLIWDDPHDAKQSESDVTRKAITEAWDTGWSSRVNDLGSSPKILVMQRLHVSDMTGHLLQRKEEGWVLLAIPMRFESGPDAVKYDAGRDIGRPDLNDPRTVDGELLFPALFPEKAVRVQEITFGSYNTAGQYQMRPNPRGGGELKREWWRSYKVRPTKVNHYILVDPAGERKQGISPTQMGEKKDNSAMGVIGMGADLNYYLIDGYRDKLNLSQRMDILFAWHQKYRPLQVGYEQYGKDTDIASIEAEMERRGYRFKITPLGGRIAKADRIRQLIPDFEAGRIWFPESLHRTLADGQVHDIIEEILEKEYLPFPVGPRDDFIDMLARIKDPEMKLVPPKADPRPTVRRRKFTDRSAGY